jgi:hypothetical protein
MVNDLAELAGGALTTTGFFVDQPVGHFGEAALIIFDVVPL